MRASLFCFLGFFAVASATNYGSIVDFKQVSNTNDTINLEWSLTDSDVAISKYTLVTDDDFSQDIRCPVAHCSHVVDYLFACTSYNFKLTPHFTDGTTGDVAQTDGNTLEEVPSAPVSPEATSTSNGILVTWQSPSEGSNCVGKYVICARIKGEVDSHCEETIDHTIVLADDIQLCSEYVVSIYASTPSGSYGPEATTNTKTSDGVPGIPQNVVVALATPTMIKINYDDPLKNPRCVEEFGVIYGEVTELIKRTSPIVTGSHEHTISPLDACTNYTIGVYGMNPSGVIGPTATQYAATADTEPLAPPSIIVEPTGPDSIDVIWGGDPTNKCADKIVICWTDHIHPEEICQEIDGGDTVDGGGKFTITDLLACSNYDVIITVESPTGISSVPISNWTFTDDIQPNPVQDLKVKTIDVHRVVITYQPPSDQAQCVKEYDTRVINLDEGTNGGLLVSETRRRNSLRIDESHNELEACTNYEFHVRTVSRTGLTSEWSIISDKTGEETPSVPRNAHITDATDTTLTVTWFQPETSPRCAVEYSIKWESDTSSGDDSVVYDPSEGLPFEMQYLVEGLPACTEVAFTLKALSPSGVESKPTTLTGTTVGCSL